MQTHVRTYTFKRYMYVFLLFFLTFVIFFFPPLIREPDWKDPRCLNYYFDRSKIQNIILIYSRHKTYKTHMHFYFMLAYNYSWTLYGSEKCDCKFIMMHCKMIQVFFKLVSSNNASWFIYSYIFSAIQCPFNIVQKSKFRHIIKLLILTKVIQRKTYAEKYSFTKIS